MLVKKFFANFINPTTRRLLRNNAIWKLVNFSFFPYRYFQHHRKYAFNYNEVKIMIDDIEHLLKDKIVLNGPFAGLRYSGFSALWSTIYPKLLGSYELELENEINYCLQQNYTDVLDIGCAEGYYAVGFALKMPMVHVHAFDINPKALASCRQMAELNKVADRVSLHGFCSPEVLQNFPFKNRALIISDCEGFEYTLFSNKEAAKNLRHCDILIELHDYSKNYLIEETFCTSHDIKYIESIDDFQKAKKYHFPEIDSFNFEQKKLILEERRTHIMEWMFLKAKA